MIGIGFLIFYLSTCFNMNCGEYGYCYQGKCECNVGFVVLNDICVETCYQEPCQELKSHIFDEIQINNRNSKWL